MCQQTAASASSSSSARSPAGAHPITAADADCRSHANGPGGCQAPGPRPHKPAAFAQSQGRRLSNGDTPARGTKKDLNAEHTDRRPETAHALCDEMPGDTYGQACASTLSRTHARLRTWHRGSCVKCLPLRNLSAPLLLIAGGSEGLGFFDACPCPEAQRGPGGRETKHGTDDE